MCVRVYGCLVSIVPLSILRFCAYVCLCREHSANKNDFDGLHELSDQVQTAIKPYDCIAYHTTDPNSQRKPKGKWKTVIILSL